MKRERLQSLFSAVGCVFTAMVLLQYDYKGLRLYGKTRGLTHTNALYLEYLDGVRASPCVESPVHRDSAKPCLIALPAFELAVRG